VTYYATYKLDGGSATQSNQTYTATATDTSGVWVTNSGSLLLATPTIKTSGGTSSQDNSSFAGLNAGLLATAGGVITVTGGSIVTSGTGANGAFSTGAGSSVTLNRVTINASADGAHAVMATQTGSMTLTNVNMTTAGGSASAIATDRGGGTINVTGGSVATSGGNSAGIYSTGAITVTGTTFKSTGAEAAVIEGANSITLTDVSLTSTLEKWGVMIYQSMSGDASGTRGVFTMTGGSLAYTPAARPLFYVTDSTGVITLKSVAATANSGVLLKAASGDWGTAGANGGTAILTADAQALTGNMAADSSSSLTVTLKNGSSLTGSINAEKTAKGADLTLDSTSTWSLTAGSYLSTLTAASVANIAGNGYNAYYDAALSGNAWLGGKTYSLTNGGSLLPAGSTATNAPAIAANGVVNAASYAAGVAPATWISIFGSNLATATAGVSTSDLVNGYLPTTFAGATVTVDGKPAYIVYASPAQINVEAPADSTTGMVNVTAKTAAGSSTVAVSMQAVMPGLFTPAAAHAGDTIELYATGLGATTTPVPPGLVFSGAYPTTTLPTVTIGGANAQVSYCGLVAAGLYQINVAVPGSLAAGTYAVVLTQNGVQSPSTAALKVVTN
jgi:uncharacterized protein (TIGR03437 family)